MLTRWAAASTAGLYTVEIYGFAGPPLPELKSHNLLLSTMHVKMYVLNAKNLSMTLLAQRCYPAQSDAAALMQGPGPCETGGPGKHCPWLESRHSSH